MPNKHARELHALESPDLHLRLQEAQNNLVGLRFSLATRKTENTTSIRDARRQIARIRTILHEREQEA